MLFSPPENTDLTWFSHHGGLWAHLFPKTPLTTLTHYPPRAPVLPGVSTTAFVGSRARRAALQLLQALWDEQEPFRDWQHKLPAFLHSSPSPPSKGGSVSCPPDAICCLFMASSSVSHAAACLPCVSSCVRNDIQPFEKCPFCSSPGPELPCLPLTDGRSSVQGAGLCQQGKQLGNHCLLQLGARFGAVLCSQPQPAWSFPQPHCGTAGLLVVLLPLIVGVVDVGSH